MHPNTNKNVTIIIIRKQELLSSQNKPTFLACSLAALLPPHQGKKKRPVQGASKHPLFSFSILQPTETCIHGGNAVTSFQPMVSIVPVKGQSSKTE